MCNVPKPVVKSNVRQSADFKIRKQTKRMSSSNSTAKLKPEMNIEQTLLEFDISVRVQDKFKLLAFGLRQKQAFVNKMHLRNVLEATKIIKSNFRKVLAKYREYKTNKDLKDMFRLVNEFDKGEGYSDWL